MDLNQGISTEVKVLLIRKGRHQTELASHLGIAESVLSRRMRGEVPWDVLELVAVAEFFETSVVDLFSAAGANLASAS